MGKRRMENAKTFFAKLRHDVCEWVWIYKRGVAML